MREGRTIVISGLGIDLLETGRIERELAQSEWQPEAGIFTAEEIRHCSACKNPALRYAACFAAKEAVMKALGVEVRDLAMFREVELRTGPGRGYEITLHSRLKAESERLGLQPMHLAIACNARQTGAMVILEAGH